MKLVEVIRTAKTSDETYNALYEVTKKMGKAPVTCKDTPGWVSTKRILANVLASLSTASSSPTCVSLPSASKACTDVPVEAVRMVERGDATAEDIDTAMEFGAGYREYDLCYC